MVAKGILATDQYDQPELRYAVSVKYKLDFKDFYIKKNIKSLNFLYKLYVEVFWI